jgi:O-antigen ligase
MKQFKLLNILKGEQLFLASAYIHVMVYAISPFLTSFSFVLFCVLSTFHFKKPYIAKGSLLWLFSFSFLFILYFLGFWFSQYTERGIELILRVSPIAIVPLIISLTGLNKLINYEKLKRSFVIGIILSCTVSILVAIVRFIITKESDSFFYFKLGSFLHIHPTYYALFIITAIHFISVTKDGLLIKYRGIIYTFLFVFIFLLQSKIALIGVFSYTLFVIVKMIKTEELSKDFLWPILLMILILSFGLSNGRFKELFIERTTIEIGNFKEDGVSQRAWLWKDALKQIKEEPLFGYGLGAQHTVFSKKAKKELLKNELSYNYSEASKIISKLNLHNQFIQILYEFGVFGLLLFIITIAIPFKKAIKHKNMSYILIQLLVLLFLSTENLLDRQMGVYFCSFILPILYFEKRSPCQNKKDIKKQ